MNQRWENNTHSVGLDKVDRNGRVQSHFPDDMPLNEPTSTWPQPLEYSAVQYTENLSQP